MSVAALLFLKKTTRADCHSLFFQIWAAQKGLEPWVAFPSRRFNMLDDHVRQAFTFDDLLLLPSESQILPRDADLSTWLTNRIALKIPIVAAAMDTVTGLHSICIAARGIGIFTGIWALKGVIEAKVKKSDESEYCRSDYHRHRQKVRKPWFDDPKNTVSVVKNKNLWVFWQTVICASKGICISGIKRIPGKYVGVATSLWRIQKTAS